MPSVSRVLQSYARAVLFGAVWCVCLASTSFAAPLPNYVTRMWTTGDGLPDSSVTAVLQSHDGYLWLGTCSGLARFDGVHFTVFDSSNTPELQSPNVTALFEDVEGTIWIGHETGKLTVYRNGKFYAVPVKASWHGGGIYGIGADSAGGIWLLNGNGELARVKDWFVIPSSPGKSPARLALVRKLTGGFWIQRDNEVWMLENDHLQPLPFDEPAGNRYIQGIGAGRDGGLWVMMESRMRKWKDGKWTEDLGTAPWGWNTIHTLIETKDGTLAAATADHGLYLIFPGQGSLQFCRTNGFPDDRITDSLSEDREGNLWVGTGNSGLAMLHPGSITAFNPPDHWQGRRVLSVACGPDDALWIGTEGAGLYRFANGSWTNFGESIGLTPPYVWSVALDAQGRTWAGTWGGGLFEWDGSRFEVPQVFGEITAQVAALLAPPDGGLLVGTGIGLMRYESGRIKWLACGPELALPDVRTMIEAPDATLWFGLSGGGLGRLRAGVLRQFRSGDGLSSDFVQCLHLESDGTLWIGTFNGLNRFKDGRFVAITKKQGLQNNIICDIEDDGRGYFWLSSHGGIMRVNQAELNRCADGQIKRLHCLTYGLSDGLPTLECSGGFQPAGCRTKDGRLWFPTSKGLVAVDTGKVRTNTLVPPVIIERLLVDDQAVNEGEMPKKPLRIAPGQHRYEFQFTGLSFVAPEKVHFRYRLEGLETRWVGTRFPRRANYSHISPGNYQFCVQACNNDGVWNKQGATLAFTVLPAFWQTWWFRISGGVLTALAGGGIVWLDARRRMRRKVERLQQQQAVERERIRIARDIHDDLGANLTRITMLSESARSGLDDSRQVAGYLDQIHNTARELTRAMSEVVWAVNPRHDTLDSVAAYLEEFGQNLLRTAGIRCKMDMPSQFPARVITAEVRHNLFLAFKEALHNAIKHSGASEVRISLAVKPAAFILTVEDNGNKFAPETLLAGTPHGQPQGSGNGLANMRQRLAEIGGRCEIEGASGKGTKVTFTVVLKGLSA
jgi:signal transduction histidine kinase/ligand-binding sensor domain-containing protein